MRLTCVVLLLAGFLAGCAPPVNRPPEPVDEGTLIWAYMGDGTGSIPPIMDTGGDWWSPGDPLTSARPDGSNELIYARLDSFGQFLPVCPPCPCEEE